VLLSLFRRLERFDPRKMHLHDLDHARRAAPCETDPSVRRAALHELRMCSSCVTPNAQLGIGDEIARLRAKIEGGE